MAKNNQKTYWPHMIVGFLVLALILSFWTVKSASSMPVQKSNQYMLKYQQADIGINQIMESKIAFDKLYTINIINAKTMVMTDNIHSNRPQENPIELSDGINVLSYEVIKKDGTKISDANSSFLLTRPHSRREDKFFKNVLCVDEKYQIKDLDIRKAGRYTLQFRAQVGDFTGYSELSAYLKPKN